MNKCYIASGWFSPEWLAELESLKAMLDKHGLKYFSPKDEAICEADAALDRQKAIFDGNVNAIKDCDWMLCNTRNKDMGPSSRQASCTPSTSPSSTSARDSHRERSSTSCSRRAGSLSVPLSRTWTATSPAAASVAASSLSLTEATSNEVRNHR
jgi:hypothetical protein